MRKNLLRPALAAMFVALAGACMSAATTVMSHPVAAFATKADAGPGSAVVPTLDESVKAFRQRVMEASATPERMKAMRKVAPSFTSPEVKYFNYMYSPDGDIWFVSGEFEYEDLNAGNPEKPYTDYSLKSYKFTLYDGDYNELGTVAGKCSVTPGVTTRVSAVDIYPQLARKFSDIKSDKYEVFVVLIENTPQYVNRYTTYSYRIGADAPLAQFEGWPVDVLNASPDPWSSVYYLTIMNEVEPEQEMIEGRYNYVDYVYDIYQPASYYTPDSKCMLTRSVRVPLVLLPEGEPVPFVSKLHNGVPYFAFNYCDKPLFEGEPWDYDNLNILPDNNLVIDLYKLTKGYPSKVEDPIRTRIPMPNPADANQPYYVYGLGMFSYGDDISFGRYTDDATMPCYVVTRENHTTLESFDYDFSVYDHQGAKVGDIASGVGSGYFLSDVKGTNPQVMFILFDDDVPSFSFVDYYAMQEVHHLENMVGDYFLNEQIDRVAAPECQPWGYQYICSMTQAEYDKDYNTLHNVIYFTPDGELDHVDALNLGQDVVLAQVQYAADYVGKYVYNTDPLAEYCLLVKRLIDKNSTASREELIVMNTEGRMLLHLVPSDDKGVIANVMFVNNTDGKSVNVMWVTPNDNYVMDVYRLPLEKFAAGDGTAENPYLVSSLADLKAVKDEPAAHYRLACDIDGTDLDFDAIKEPFTGTIDGDGHAIKGLEVTTPGMFVTIAGGTVKNLWLIDCSLTTADDNTAGFIASTLEDATLENIHADNLSVTDRYGAELGSFAGMVYGKTSIKSCSVRNAKVSISIPASQRFYFGMYGGLVGRTPNNGTSLHVDACSFSGEVDGHSIIGGIIAELNGTTSLVSNCHVNATITGRNTIGGIAAVSKRSPITNCYVEGEFTATDNSNTDSWNPCGPVMGGIVGQLTRYNGDNDAPAETAPVMAGNVVNVTFHAYEVPESALKKAEFESQFDTFHRIIGYSRAQEPEMKQNGTFGDIIAEDNITNNYATGDVATAIEAVATSTEGATIAAADIAGAFLAGELGWAYGNTPASPWRDLAAACQVLYHEVIVYIGWPVAKINVPVGQEVEVAVTVSGVSKGSDVVFEVSDSAFEIVSVENTGSRYTVVLTCSADKATATLTAKCLDTVSSIDLVGVDPMGVADALVPGRVIAIRGNAVVADGAAISVHSISGAMVAQGRDHVDLSTLPAGVYVATAPGYKPAKFVKR